MFPLNTSLIWVGAGAMLVAWAADCAGGRCWPFPMGAMSPFWPVDGPFRAVGRLMGCVCPEWRAWHARLAFRGLSYWEASVSLNLWF